MTCHAARHLPPGWRVGSTGREGLTAILGPDVVVTGDWVRLIVAYACDRAQAEALVARLNGRTP